MYKDTKKSPSTPKAVNYFHHFPTNFLRPYGLADEKPDDGKIQRRIAPLNCEWLTRPKIATSEFADTLNSNLQMLSTSESKFVQNNRFLKMQQRMELFLNALRKFNTLKTDENPGAADVKTLMKSILEDNEQQDDFFSEMFQLGGAMYLLGSHYWVVKSLMSNPDYLAEKTVGTTNQVKSFKANPTVKGLKEYLTQLCTAETSNVNAPSRTSVKRNLAQMLDSDEDEEDQPDQDQPQEDERHQLQEEPNQQTQQSSTRKEKPKKKKRSHTKV